MLGYILQKQSFRDLYVHSCVYSATILSYHPFSSVLTVFTRHLQVCAALYQSMSINYMVRKSKVKGNHVCHRVGPHQHFSSSEVDLHYMFVWSLTFGKGYSRQWNMKDGEPGSWRRGFF